MAGPCWSCREAVEGAVCVACGAIQPLRADVGLFRVLGLERAWSLDAAAVGRAWRGVSRRVHPDRFAGRPAVERRMALQWTATVNEAKRVLSDPLMRACYLATGQARLGEEGAPALPPAFLEEMFELQMMAHEAPAAVRETALAMRAKLMEQLEEMMQRWEAGGETLDAVPQLLAQMRYVERAIDRSG